MAKPTPLPRQRLDFVTVFNKWMADQRFTRKTVAEITRSTEKDVTLWERGLGKPTNNQFTRLVRCYSLFGKVEVPSDKDILAAIQAEDARKVALQQEEDRKLLRRRLPLSPPTAIASSSPSIQAEPPVQAQVEDALLPAKRYVTGERFIDNAVITEKILAAASRGPQRLPTMLGTWKSPKRFVHDHAIKRFRSRYLEGTGRGYSNDECRMLIDQLVETAYACGHFEILRDRRSGTPVTAVAVPGPRDPLQIFGFIVAPNDEDAVFPETIVTCRPAQSAFNTSEISVNQPFVGLVDELASFLAKKPQVVLPSASASPEMASASPEEMPSSPSEMPSSPPEIGPPSPSPYPAPLYGPGTNPSDAPLPPSKTAPKERAKKQTTPQPQAPQAVPNDTFLDLINDPARAINDAVRGGDDRTSLSHEEAELALAYALAKKDLRIQNDSLVIAERIVEAIKQKITQATAEIAKIQAKMDDL